MSIITKDHKYKHISNLVTKPEDNRSIIMKIAELPNKERLEILEKIAAASYPHLGLKGIRYDWSINGRPDQLIPLNLENDWNIFALNCGRGTGKELDINTPILTSKGWKTQGTLVVGDVIFDEMGNKTTVTEVFPEIVPGKCYRIWFSDGTYIDASGDHRWATVDSDERSKITRHMKNKLYASDWVNWEWIRTKPGKVLSEDKFNIIKDLQLNNYTKQKIQDAVHLRWSTITKCFGIKKYQDIFESVSSTPVHRIKDTNTLYLTQKNKSGGRNHTIPNTKPLNFEDIALPIPPYTYGCWLADGFKHHGSISQSKDDWKELATYIEDDGFKYGDYSVKRCSFPVYGLSTLLRKSGLLGRKQVIEEYKYASVRQREELLAGLLDCDGSYSGDGGQVYFYNTDRNIVELVQFLVLSLGMIPRTFLNPNYHNGKRGKDIYRVVFSPTKQVFKLKRKQKQIKFNGFSFIQRFHRYIDKIELIDSKPMRCISVDSPNHLYLCGEQLVPTSNTRTSSEWVRHMAQVHPGCRIALVGATTSDVHKTMLAGDSGLLTVTPEWEGIHHIPSYNRIEWKNGSIAEYFSAEKPDRLRGPQYHYAWLDEITSWKNAEETFNMLSFGLRLGRDNRILISTTPKNQEFYKKLLGMENTWTLVASTFDNMANLSEKFIKDMVSRYEGTRLGNQELNADVLDDVEGALWRQSWIDKNRVKVDKLGTPEEELPEFLHISLAIDPAMTTNKNSDETGMAVVAYAVDDKYYVLYADSEKLTPHEWAKRAFRLYDEFMVTSIVAETNQGGDMVKENLTKLRPDVSIHGIHAKKGKALRAEEVVHSYELNKIRHVGMLPRAESQMTEFNPITNPNGKDDIVDALVYAVKACMEKAMVSSVYSPSVGGLRHKLMNFRAR